MNKQRVINFYGGPGSGKSTLAAAFFAECKFRGMTPELSVEWVKGAQYEGRNHRDGKLTKAQEYIWAKQHFQLLRLTGQVDFVITDSPVVMGLAYMSEGYIPALRDAILQSYDMYDNLNFFVKRTKAYIKIGREQTEEEAVQKDEQIRAILEDNDIPYIEVESHPLSASEHIPGILAEIGWPVKPNPYGKFSCQPSVTVPEYPFEHVTIESGTNESVISAVVSRYFPQPRANG